MEIQQLRYLVAVADTGNFTRAAERTFVSQPSLSQQIINLEEELGHKLFHRLGRRAVPTDAGETFIAKARNILNDIENATRAMRDDPAFARKVTIGAIPTVAPYLLPALLQRCQREHPGLLVQAREDFRAPLCEAVREGDLDLALVSLPIQEPQLSIEPLFTERLLLCVGREHPLARKREIKAEDLVDQTFVLLGDSSTLASQIQRFCGDHHFQPKIGYRCSQIRTVKSFTALGLGVSILPQVTRSAEDRDLIYRELQTEHAPTREIALVRHLQRYQSRGVEAFISVLRLALRSYRWGTPIERTPTKPPFPAAKAKAGDSQPKPEPDQRKAPPEKS